MNDNVHTVYMLIYRHIKESKLLSTLSSREMLIFTYYEICDVALLLICDVVFWMTDESIAGQILLTLLDSAYQEL